MSIVFIYLQAQAVSIDCPTLVEFASYLGMQSAQPAIWTQLNADCCAMSAVTNVYCERERVTRISWPGRGLNGFINSSSLPSNVTSLNLGPNQLTGSLSSHWPSGLLFLELDGNLLSGDVPSFPSTLEHLRLGYPGYPGNLFTGTIRLNRAVDVMINYNWITDLVIQDTSALGTGDDRCDLSYNPLLGNSNIAGLVLCTKIGLYSAASLPITRSTLKSATGTIAFNIPTSIVILTSFLNNLSYTLRNTLQTTATISKVRSDLKWETGTVSLSLTNTLGTITSISELNSSTNTLGTITSISELYIDFKTVVQASIVPNTTTVLSTFYTNFSSSTVKFEPNIVKLTTNWTMMCKVLLNGMILAYAISKTPFRREMNRVATTWSFKDKTISK